jgi:hypothetical protein
MTVGGIDRHPTVTTVTATVTAARPTVTTVTRPSPDRHCPNPPLTCANTPPVTVMTVVTVRSPYFGSKLPRRTWKGKTPE